MGAGALIALALGFLLAACGPGGLDVDDTGTAIARPSFELAVVGDFGTGGPKETEVADVIRRWQEEHPLDALVTTGDNVYPSGDPSAFHAAWEEPYGWVSDEEVEVIASLGNHDIESEADGEPVLDLLGAPGPWYRKTVGDADIVVLDSNRIDDQEQLEWLKSTLPELTSAWQIVVFHHPAYSCAHHDSTPEVVVHWVPLLEDAGVDLVLNGHDHNYQRFAAEGGTNYVVTGGGGARLYQTEDCPEGTPERVSADDERHHFLILEGNERQLRLRVIGSDETLIDNATLAPRGG